MTTPNFSTEAGLAGGYPSSRFNARERKLLASAKVYIDSLSPDTVITTQGDIIIGNASGDAVRLAKGSSGLPLVAGASTVSYAALAAGGLASDSVTTAKILDLNVTTGKLAADAVDGTKIADLAVDTEHLAASAVETDKINDLAVTTGKLAADAVDGTKIADDAISAEHLDDGILPSHVVKFAGKFTTAGGDTAEQASVPGVVAGDIVIASLQTEGASPVTLDASAPDTDVINFTMSADPSTDHIISYSVLRAVS